MSIRITDALIRKNVFEHFDSTVLPNERCAALKPRTSQRQKSTRNLPEIARGRNNSSLSQITEQLFKTT